MWNTDWTMIKGATAVPGVFINLLLNEGTFMLICEGLIISLFHCFLFLNILLFLHLMLSSQHVRFSFLLGPEENYFLLHPESECARTHTIIGTMYFKRGTSVWQTLTCLVVEVFRFPPGRSDIISPCATLRQAASLSRTCLMPSLDWKKMELK